MKRITFFLLFSLIFLISGCLSYRAVEWRIHFNENFNSGKVTVTFEDLTSDELNLNIFSKEDSTKTRKEERIRSQMQSDFHQLLQSYQGDEFLLDGVSMGVYIKERHLFEKNGRLYGSFSGIFKELNPDEDMSLLINKDVIVLTLQNDSNTERIETDGKKTVGQEVTTITWPKTRHTIYWKAVMKRENPELSHSLIDEFHDWQGSK